MKQFEGILLCSDLDGTLLSGNKSVSEENLKAIEYFKSEGGRFTFITGRMPLFVSEFYNLIHPNAPIGCINGGGIYDYAAGKYLWTQAADPSILDLVELVDKHLDGIGIQVNTFEHTYFCKDDPVMVWFRVITGAKHLVRHYREIDEPIAKILFGVGETESMEALENLLRSHPAADRFDFVCSEKKLFEILTKGINKGTLLVRMAEILKIDLSKTVAVGDYNNDIAMLRAAGLGIAVANACDAAKEAADHVTVSNEEHAIARIISDLDTGILKL